jgi:hypothetical protein
MVIWTAQKPLQDHSSKFRYLSDLTTRTRLPSTRLSHRSRQAATSAGSTSGKVMKRIMYVLSTRSHCERSQKIFLRLSRFVVFRCQVGSHPSLPPRAVTPVTLPDRTGMVWDISAGTPLMIKEAIRCPDDIDPQNQGAFACRA